MSNYQKFNYGFLTVFGDLNAKNDSNIILLEYVIGEAWQQTSDKFEHIASNSKFARFVLLASASKGTSDGRCSLFAWRLCLLVLIVNCVHDSLLAIVTKCEKCGVVYTVTKRI